MTAVRFFQCAVAAAALLQKIAKKWIAGGIAGHTAVIIDCAIEPRVTRCHLAIKSIDPLASLRLLFVRFVRNAIRAQPAKLITELIDSSGLLAHTQFSPTVVPQSR